MCWCMRAVRGTYELNALPFDQGHPSPTGPLARVVVAGEPLPMTLPAALPKPPLEPIRDSEITGRRTLVLGATSPQNDAAGHWQEFTFTVDGKIFDPSRIDQRVRLGAVEQWTIRNTHEHDDHMFHIHTNPFQVVEISGQPQADRGVAGYRGRAAAGQRRQRRHPLAVPRLHRRLHAALSHDEPRGDGHDAGGRGLQGLTRRARPFVFGHTIAVNGLAS
jgi:FtsP/CotA-like multicopper oxidase with cupredoxin domain